MILVLSLLLSVVSVHAPNWSTSLVGNLFVRGEQRMNHTGIANISTLEIANLTGVNSADITLLTNLDGTGFNISADNINVIDSGNWTLAANFTLNRQGFWEEAFRNITLYDSIHGSWDANHSEWDSLTLSVAGNQTNWTNAASSVFANTPLYYNSTTIDGVALNIIINWTQNTGYPDPCPSGTWPEGVNDTLTCIAPIANDIDPGAFPNGTYTINNVTFDSTTDRVGIGTTSPDEIVHIAKAVSNAEFVGLLIENSEPNTAGSKNETAEIRFGFGGNNDVGRITITKNGDYATGADEDSSMRFWIDINGVATKVASIINSGLLLGVAASKVDFNGDAGGGGQGLRYKDLGGTLRNALIFPGSDIVALSNQAANGTVEIRANSDTAGSGGEVTVATFEDDNINFSVNVSASFYTGDGRLLANTAGFYGSLQWPGVTGCEWITTSDTFVNLSADAECDDAARTLNGLVTSNISVGNAEGQVPQIKFDSLPAGNYLIRAPGYYHTSDSEACHWRFTDGSQNISSNPIGGGADFGGGGTVNGDFFYTTDQGATTFTLQATRQTANTCTLSVADDKRQFEISVYFFPSFV